MKWLMGKIEALFKRAAMTEPNGPETIVDEIPEAPRTIVAEPAEIPHAEPGAFQTVKAMVKGHGEQTVLPDDCQFGDNDLCYVDA